MEAVSTYRQSILDIAIQHLGDAQRAFDIALANGRGIADDIEPGDRLTLDEAQRNRRMVQYFTVNALMPATSLEDNVVTLEGGINFMGIQIDFVVS